MAARKGDDPPRDNFFLLYRLTRECWASGCQASLWNAIELRWNDGKITPMVAENTDFTLIGYYTSLNASLYRTLSVRTTPMSISPQPSVTTRQCLGMRSALVISLCARCSDLLQEIIDIKWHANDGNVKALQALPDLSR